MKTPSVLGKSSNPSQAPRLPVALRAAIASVLLAATPAMAAAPAQESAKTAEKSQSKPIHRWKNVEEGVYAFYNAKTTREKREILLGMAHQFPLNVLGNSQAIPPEISSEILSIAAKNAAKNDPIGYLEFVSNNGSEMIREDFVKLATEKLLVTDPARITEFAPLINAFPTWGPKFVAQGMKTIKQMPKEKLVKK